MLPEIELSKVKGVVPARSGDAVVVQVEVRLDSAVTELEIAITTEQAASVAIALLAGTARARSAHDGLDPALEVLAAAVVPSGSAEKVRLQLLFDKGAVLPVEMPTAAGESLRKDLAARAAADPMGAPPL